MTNATLREEQLEQHAKDHGAERVRKQITEAIEKGRGAGTPGGIQLMKRAIEPLAKAITASINDAQSGKAGRRMTAAKLLEKIDPEVAAYFGLKEVLNQCMKVRSEGLSAVASRIGRIIESELRLAQFEGEEPNLYNTLVRKMRERGATPDHQERVLLLSATKAAVDMPTFTRNDKLHLGMKLIDIVIDVTGFIEVVNISVGRNKTRAIIRPTEKVAEWIKGRNVSAELLSPLFMPMVVQPREWEGLHGGGYKTSALRPIPLVKRATKEHLALLETANMPSVYAGLNAIQNTAWRVNSPVLETMGRVWESGSEIAVPNKHDKEVPRPTEKDLKPDGKATKEWRRMAREIHEKNASSRGRRLQLDQLLVAARSLQHEPALYFPHNLDFRGRAYAVPVNLNPQGSDYSRALLTFAKGKPIETPRDIGWLAIQGANLFGFDKVSLAERIDWVDDRHKLIEQTLDDPHRDLWWTEADKPWCFLAWCFEYAAFLRHGNGYVSSLPMSVDGSCNGLQHFSAMLRDPVGGAAVNLVPMEKPADIYQRVADVVIEKLQAMNTDWVARGWIDFGVDRKVTKRPVMVLPYGGTFRSCLKYVQEAVAKKIDDGMENPFGEELFKANSFLAKLVWESIGDVVVAARTAMSWLQGVARKAAISNHALTWTAPSGFPAYQAYRDERARRVKTRLQGSLIYLSLNDTGTRLDVDRQAQGISPNFVHSMDAAAMMLTIELAKHNGVDQFAMIHDSYGTVAADMDILSTCLREAFVDMYRDHNVLAEFLAGIPEEVRAKCKPVPEMGKLDLDAVLQSEFFFA